MDKQLLIDYNVFEVSPQQINESLANNGGRLIVQGVLQRAEAKNHNGRVYPMETLMREAKKYNESYITERRALGELDHPDSSIINLKNVCHNIRSLWWDNDNLMGKIEILPTPSGNILKQLFLNNITVGISSRGMGSVRPLGEGTVEVQDDFELLCWDFVSTPSTQGAFMKPVGLNENFNPILFKGNKYVKVNNLISEIICSQTGVCCIK